MDKKDLVVLSQFRRNARENLTSASKATKIPISTLYEKLRRMEGTCIKRHASIIDFAKIGYGLRVSMVLKVAPSAKEQLLRFLERHPRINSLFEITNGFDYMIEVILKDLEEVSRFNSQLAGLGVVDRNEFFVLQDIRREAFLLEPDLVDACLPKTSL